MSKNIIDKIWDEHVVKSKDGFPDIFAIDLHLVHEVTSPQAFSVLRERGLELHSTERTVATVDHNVSTSWNRLTEGSDASKNQMEALRKNCRDFGVQLMDMNSGKQGIVHVIGPELGITQPGLTVVCGDSHTSTHGAFGAIAFGIGTTEIGHVMATGCMLQNRPKTMKIDFQGKIGKGVYAKDLVLKLIHEIGVRGGTGYILEYCGEAIRGLNMEERMTICNMSIECGARAGLISPDETTFEYIKGRKCAPKGEDWNKAVEYWRSLASDENSEYDEVVVIDVDNLEPMVTWGINPEMSVSISEKTPLMKEMKKEDAELAKAAFDYTKLNEGQEIEGVDVDYVFIGSCTNARITDMREAAEIIKGKKVSDNLNVYVVPGSEGVKRLMEDEGLIEVFKDAGVEVRNPGCSMCLAMNEDKVPAGKRCASTSNRNFIGRQGKGAITHLMSPAMAAAAAIEGKIVDVRKYLD